MAAIRFGLEFRQQDDLIAFSFFGLRWQGTIGVYYVMPLLLLIGNVRGVFAGLGYGKLLLFGVSRIRGRRRASPGTTITHPKLRTCF